MWPSAAKLEPVRVVDASEPFSTVAARDGRRIGLLEVGRTDGVPLFHFHGSGSSRLEVLVLADLANRLGVRLIGLDRPGVGRSDPTSHDGLLDWPDMVIDVADALGIKKFAVAGMSAGGPYALACAFKIPDRLTACGVIGTLSSPSLMARASPLPVRVVWFLGSRFPRVLEWYLRFAVADSGFDVGAMEKRITRWVSWTNAADRALLAEVGTRRILARALAENLRQGAAAARREPLIETASWGFTPDQIAFTPVRLWHGLEDRLMPVSAARLMAATIPGCRAAFFPGEGHFSVLLNHGEEILHALTASV